MDSKWSQGDNGALGHPQQHQQAQLRQVKLVPVVFIKNLHDTCLYAIFQGQIDLKWYQYNTM